MGRVETPAITFLDLSGFARCPVHDLTDLFLRKGSKNLEVFFCLLLNERYFISNPLTLSETEKRLFSVTKLQIISDRQEETEAR